MTLLKSIALTTVAIGTLAACAGTAPVAQTAPAMGGMTFDQLRGQYPDLSAVEFARLDDNGDGLVDAEEQRAISDEDVIGVVGEVDVRDN